MGVVKHKDLITGRWRKTGTAAAITGGAVAEYTPVPCIRFTGDQTVDTGVICNQNTKIRIVYTRDSADAMYMYGVVNTGNTASVTAYLSTGGTWRFGNKGIAANINADADLVQTAVVTKTGFVRANLTQSMSGVSDFTTIGSLVIGACRNANGTVGASQFVGKILLFEMWDGDTLLRKLCPVVSRDGVYGFLDSVGGGFYASITDTPLDGGNL